MDKVLGLLGVFSMTLGVLMVLDFAFGGPPVMGFSGVGAIASGISLFAFAAIITLLQEIRDNTRK